MKPSSKPVVSGALTPMVWIRTPIARAASAATNGPGRAGVVGAVGDEDDRAGPAGQVLELAQRERERGADAGAVGELPDLHPLQHLAEQLGVGRERRLEERAAGEDDQAEEVALAPPGEVAQHRRATSSRLPGLKSVAFMLLEMSSASMRFRALLRTSRTSCGDLRPRERHDQQRRARRSEHLGQQPPAGARPAGRLGREEAEHRESRSARSGGRRRRRNSRTRQRAPGHHEQEEEPGISEPHRAPRWPRAARCHRSSRSRARAV